MRYVYSVVRFVPDPARGEFVNVGAIAGSEDSSEWLLRQVDNPVRARAVDDRKALGVVWAFLDRVGREMDEYEKAQESLFEPSVELSEEWLRRLYVEHRNVVQLSPPTPMVADSADEALDRVFDQMVLDPALRRHPFQKKHAALAALRAAYRKYSVRKGVNLRERVALETANHRERFDFAVTNGHALQLTHTWSFQVPDQELVAEQVKAWGWTVRDVQQGGGTVKLADGSQFEVHQDVDVEVVYVPPAPGQDAPAMRDALGVFEALKVAHTALEGADLVGARAHDLLVAAGVGRLDIKPGGS
jgi:hypothetical protein